MRKGKIPRWLTAIMAYVGLALVFLAVLLGVFIFCLRGMGKPDAIPEQYQVKEEETGAVSDYMLNITDREAIGLKAVDDWLTGCDPSGEGFQWLIYTDPDSWDAFFYLPSIRERVGNLTNNDVTITVTEEDSGRALNIYLHTRADMGKGKPAEEQLLHFIAPLRGAWPNEARVYIDGKELSCDGRYIIG